MKNMMVKDKHRVITMLDRRELDFLDKLGKDSLFSTGHKLSHSEILRGLVDTAMDVRLSAEGVDSMSALEKKMLEEIRKAVTEMREEKLKRD